MEITIYKAIDRFLSYIDHLRFEYGDPTPHTVNISEIIKLSDDEYQVLIEIRPSQFILKNVNLYDYKGFEVINFRHHHDQIDLSFIVDIPPSLLTIPPIGRTLLSEVPTEIIEQTLLYLPYNDVLNFCQASKAADKICRSDTFWFDKFVIDYGYTPRYIYGRMKEIYINNDALYSFGYNKEGALGRLKEFNIQPLPILTDNGEVYLVTQISCGLNHSLIVDRLLKSFGSNNNRQLGHDYLSISYKPLPLSHHPKMISCGSNHSMFIDQDDKVWGFGLNCTRQLEFEWIHNWRGHRDIIDVPTEIMKMGLPIFAKSVACGSHHSVVRDMDDNLIRFGSKDLGLKGQPTAPEFVLNNQKQPFKVKLISAGNSFSLFTDLEDNLWGFGSIDKLGIGKSPLAVRYNPIPILKDDRTPFKVKFIASHFSHSLIIDLEDNLWGFGDNEYGQLGLGHNEYQYRPQPILDLDGNPIKAKEAAVGQFHSLIINLDDELLSCGKNISIGYQSDSEINPYFTKVLNRQGHPYLVKSVAAGGTFSLIRLL